MPTRAIPFVIVALVAAGYAVYQNKEQVLEFMDRGRRKIKEYFEQPWEHGTPERPFEGRRRHSNDHQDYFEAGLRKEEEAEGLIPSSALASGHLRRSSIEGFRQRNVGDEKRTQSVQSSVLFDASSSENRFPLESLSRSRRSSSSTISGGQFHEKEFLPPPLPPRRSTTPLAEEGVAHAQTEPVYETAHNAAIVPSPRASTPVLVAPVSSSPVAVQVQVQSSAALPSPQPPATETSSSTPSNSQILPPFKSNPHWSIHEWQEGITSPSPPASPSVAGSAPEEIDDNLDVMSNFGSEVSSEGGWTEVGSSISGDN